MYGVTLTLNRKNMKCFESNEDSQKVISAGVNTNWMEEHSTPYPRKLIDRGGLARMQCKWSYYVIIWFHSIILSVVWME